MKRREFFPKAIYGSAIVAAIPVVMASCEKDEDPVIIDNNNNNNNNSGNPGTIDLTDPNFSSLNQAGGFAYSGPIIIINTNGTDFIALSSLCTHSGCTVNFSDSSGLIVCPCHGSQFSNSGAVVQGPASSALRTYNVSREGDILTIS